MRLYLALLITLLLSIGLVSATSPSMIFPFDLSISKAPRLGQTAEITITLIEEMKYNYEYPFTIRFILPSGLKIVKGDLIVVKYLDSEIESKITVRAVKKGDWIIKGVMEDSHNLGFWEKIDTIHLSVGRFWSREKPEESFFEKIIATTKSILPRKKAYAVRLKDDGILDLLGDNEPIKLSNNFHNIELYMPEKRSTSLAPIFKPYFLY